MSFTLGSDNLWYRTAKSGSSYDNDVFCAVSGSDNSGYNYGASINTASATFTTSATSSGAGGTFYSGENLNSYPSGFSGSVNNLDGAYGSSGPDSFQNGSDPTTFYQYDNFTGQSATASANQTINDLLAFINFNSPSHVYSAVSTHTTTTTHIVVYIGTQKSSVNTYFPFTTVKANLLNDLASQFNASLISSSTLATQKSAINGESCTTFYNGAVALPSTYCTLTATTTTTTTTTTASNTTTTTTTAKSTTSTSSTSQMNWIYIIVVILVLIISFVLGRRYLHHRSSELGPKAEEIVTEVIS